MDTTCGATHFEDWGNEANYDLNVYFNDYDDSNKWRIIAYKIPSCGCTDSSSDNEISATDLSDIEAEQLTLGISEEAGGDYGADSDFWLDKYGFLDIYKQVPQRIKQWLYDMPPYITPHPHERKVA